MFLLECEEDGSLSIIEDEDVVFCEGVKEGDTVRFFCSGKEWTGDVLMRSDQKSELHNKRSEILAMRKKEKKVKAEAELKSNVLCPSKRKPRPVRPYSPSGDKTDSDVEDNAKKSRVKRQQAKVTSKAIKTAKQSKLNTLFNDELDDGNSSGSNSLDSSIKEQIVVMENSKNRSNDDPAPSPSKEELKKMLAEARAANSSLAAASKLEFKDDDSRKSLSVKKAEKKKADGSESDEKDFSPEKESVARKGESSKKGESRKSKERTPKELKSSDEDAASDIEISGRQLQQLYGKDWAENPKDKMVLLTDGIYCKESVLSLAMGASQRKTTSFLRNIIKGVFKSEMMRNVTLTGQAPRAAGRVDDPTKIVPLDPVAVDAVIKYSRAVSKKLGWDKIPNTKSLKKTLTQRIGEIKRELAAQDDNDS